MRAGEVKAGEGRCGEQPGASKSWFSSLDKREPASDARYCVSVQNLNPTKGGVGQVPNSEG